MFANAKQLLRIGLMSKIAIISKPLFDSFIRKSSLQAVLNTSVKNNTYALTLLVVTLNFAKIFCTQILGLVELAN